MNKISTPSPALFFLCALLLVSTIATAQDGMLDSTFGKNGIVTSSLGTGNDFGNTVVLQPDGKIVVAGNSGNNLALIRYLINGSIDPTFGSTGTVSTNIGCANAIGSSCILQPDGKIIVGGYCGIFPNYDFTVTRYNSNGLIDNMFGSGGTVRTPILSGGDQGTSITLQPNGKILVGGFTDNGSNSDLALVRYNSDGTLDTSFDSDGIVTTSVGPAGDMIRSIAVQSDGKIVVAGFSYTSASFSYDFVVLRYNTNGSLDNTFGSGGILTTAIVSNNNDYGESIAIQPDGKILVGGYSYTGFLLLARYETDGTLDKTFGSGGKVSTPFGCVYQNDYSLALQKDGKILLGGFSTLRNTNSDFAVARYNANGIIDQTFGDQGIATTPIGIGDDIATSIAIASDGKIVVAGRTHNGSNFDIAVVRYNSTNPSSISSPVDPKGIEIHHNPLSNQIEVSSDTYFNEATIIFYNYLGQIVYEINNISGQSVTISKDNLPVGLNFVRLTENGVPLFYDKIIVVR